MLNIPISKELCVNNNLKGLEVKLYLVLYKEALEKSVNGFQINISSVMNRFDIRDRRTFKKMLNKLSNLKLLTQTDIATKRFDITLEINEVVDLSFAIDENEYNSIIGLSEHTIKLYLFYKFFVIENKRKPNISEIKKLIQFGAETVTIAMNELKSIGIIDKLDSFIDYDKNSLIYNDIKDMVVKRYFQDNKISEYKLEQYLIMNLCLIEDGLEIIKNQLNVRDGIIDILAKDKNGRLCIIELKIVSDDEKIVFQSLYYPTQILGNPRMITIAPSYDYKIKTALQKLEYVEMKIYKIENDRLTIEDEK